MFGGDNRAGIDRTLHRISCIRNRDGTVVGLTCRVGRAVPGAAVMVADLVEQGRSILLLGTCGEKHRVAALFTRDALLPMDASCTIGRFFAMSAPPILLPTFPIHLSM